MGQYYKPTLIGARGKIRWLYSHEYNNGLKLMEHSYIGNNFVNAVLSQILDHPMKLAWIGDYSPDVYKREWGGEPYQKMEHDKFVQLFSKIWGGENSDDETKIHPLPLSGFENIKDFDGWYLVNHTQKIYISMTAYMKRNKWRESYTNRKTGATERWDMCVNPLPLLTACGNGRGGGDYYSGHPDYDKVGSWAFDRIEFTSNKPDDYQEVNYHFTEQEG